MALPRACSGAARLQTAQLRAATGSSRPPFERRGRGRGGVRAARAVGKYPVLREGGYRDDEQSYGGGVGAGRWKDGTFVYQSQAVGAPAPSAVSSLVPGTIDEPTGAPFDVDVPFFALVRPDFFF